MLNGERGESYRKTEKSNFPCSRSFIYFRNVSVIKMRVFSEPAIISLSFSFLPCFGALRLIILVIEKKILREGKSKTATLHAAFLYFAYTILVALKPKPSEGNNKLQKGY